MRTFGCQTFDSGRGFTLIETLVVMFIITLLVGLALTRMPQFVQSADLEKEVRRLELLLAMARTEAMMESSEFGFRQTIPGYEFLRYDDASQDWNQAEAPFHERTLPDGLRMTLRADSEGFGFPGEGVPSVLILSSGETTPFRLILESRGDGSIRTLLADGYGGLRRDSDDS